MLYTQMVVDSDEKQLLADEETLNSLQEPMQPALHSIFGACLVLLMVISDVALAEFVSQSSERYRAPFTTVYLNHSATGAACMLAGYFLLLRREQALSDVLRGVGFESRWSTVAAAFGMASLWQFYNSFWAVAVSMTTVTIVNSVSQSRCVIVCVLSTCLLSERITCVKMLAVALCVVGVVVVSITTGEDTESGLHPIAGIACAFILAGGQALHTVIWSRWFGQSDYLLTVIFVGLMGMANFSLFWPALPLMAESGIELNPPPTATQVLMLSEAALLSVTYNFLFFFATAVTSPVFVTLGMGLKIPLSALADWLLRGKIPSAIPAIGMVAIATSFTLMTLQRSKDSAPAQPRGTHRRAAPIVIVPCPDESLE